ncbi:hypothetical protein F5Y09DRAFT_354111 [Xylaria sp. FL1042]|nr:hypothetical protein F5Y09DRAFT_354111 [Xylaria sp. FL1042]
MLSVVAICMRAILLLISAVILGLSVSMAKYQATGPVPASTSFSIFSGAAGFFASTVGMAALWYDRIHIKILFGLDTIMSFFFLAAAITITLALKTIQSCTSRAEDAEYNRSTNEILSGGCIVIDNEPVCLHCHTLDGTDLTPGRCNMARADSAFQYVGSILAVAMMVIAYLLSRRGRGGTPTPTRSYNQG